MPCNASSAMADIVLRACDYDPNMRFTSAAEMKQALMSATNGTYKISAANDPNRTVSVRKAPADYDKTTSIRKATAANNQMPGQIGTFGNAPRKNNSLKIVATVLAATMLMGIGIFAVPKLINRSGESGLSNNSLTTIFETEGYSKLDEEKIASIITEAEALAATEDYEGALKKVQTGLATYPKSEDLQEKSEKYTTALNAQVKDATIAEAQKLADSGDYKAAMSLIQKAIDTYGDDADYQAKYNIYNDAYIAEVKAEAITTADKLANTGDYLGAVRIVKTAMKTVGEDIELMNKAETYENSYVLDVIVEIDGLIAANDYSTAETILTTAIGEFPNNSSLKDEKETLEKKAHIEYLFDKEPYMVENANLYMRNCDPNTVVSSGTWYYSDYVMSSGGESYLKGMQITPKSGQVTKIYYNLRGQYS